jgi:hypothetical protein
MSLIAFADLFPEDRVLKETASRILEDSDVKNLLAHHRYEYGASWVVG